MPTDLTALAETFARYSRQVAGLAEPFTLPQADRSPGVEPARARMAAAVRQLDEPGPLPAVRLQRVWIGALNDLKYLEEDALRETLGRFIAAAEDGLRFIAACRAAVGPADAPAELAKAEERYEFVRRLARRRLDAVGRPWQPGDPERFAAAMRQVAAGEGVPAEVLLAEFRQRAAAERAGR
jgi:hypothetical protein